MWGLLDLLFDLLIFLTGRMLMSVSIDGQMALACSYCNRNFSPDFPLLFKLR